jgi:hypothetical protein
VHQTKYNHSLAQLQARTAEMELSIERMLNKCKRMIAIAQKKQRSAQLCAKDAMAERDRAVERLEMLGRRISAVANEHEASDQKKDGDESRKSLDTIDLD